MMLQLVGIFISMAIGAILLISVLLTLPYIWFGLKIMFKKMTSKNNVGLMFIRNLADNYPLPHVIDLRKDEYKFKIGKTEYTYLINREHFTGFKFLNLPCVYFDANNMVTSIGLHFHKLDAEGEPQYHENGDPVISIEKQSYSLSPSLIKAILSSTALTQAIQELFNKHRTLFIIIAGIGIGIGAMLYLQYNLTETDIPMIMDSLNQLKDICMTNTTTVVSLNG